MHTLHTPERAQLLYANSHRVQRVRHYTPLAITQSNVRVERLEFDDKNDRLMCEYTFTQANFIMKANNLEFLGIRPPYYCPACTNARILAGVGNQPGFEM